MPKRKPKIKNPSLFDVGYHITSKKNLNSILEKGLLVKPYKGSLLEYSIVYNNKHPLWFLSTKRLSELSESLRGYLYDAYIKKADKGILLTVNVSNFDHLPDIYALTEMSNRLRITSDIIQSFADPNLVRVPKFIIPYLAKFDNTIPLEEFVNDLNLAQQTINYTKSFCIIKNIPSKNILDIVEL